MPTLWLYATNDSFFSPVLGCAMYAAFAATEAGWSSLNRASSGMLELIKVYTQKPDRQRVFVDPSAVHNQLAPDVPNLPAYSDRKQMVAAMPDTEGGCVQLGS